MNIEQGMLNAEIKNISVRRSLFGILYSLFKTISMQT